MSSAIVTGQRGVRGSWEDAHRTSMHTSESYLMELPRRSRGDELLRPGQLASLRLRLRRIAARHDLVTVIACAFDHRTRMLPFIYADTRMAPGGVRSIGSAMVDAGFTKTRIVLQQWNKHFKPSEMKLD